MLSAVQERMLFSERGADIRQVAISGDIMALEKLLTPGRIGNMELNNRLVFAPIAARGAGPEGTLSDALARFYEVRAKGGMGLVIMGHTYCWREEQTDGAMGLWCDAHIPPLADLVRRMHSYGPKVAVELGGRGTRRPDGHSIAPSPVRFAFEDKPPKEIPVEQIEYFVECYGQAARRAREAGFDAVEIHAAHGKLVSLFLSSYSNRRTDAYGGTLEKRTLFPRQIVQAIRKQAGEDFPIIFRFSVDDMVEGGNTLEDGKQIARIMAAEGVDAFECSAGNQEKGWNTSFNYFFPRNCLAHLARPVGEASGKPVITVGKIHDPLAAELLLEEGAADFISLGRPFITDPELLIKAREGRYRDIKRCIYCLNCFTYKSRKDRIPTPGITCTVNPAAMREAEFPKPEPAAEPRRILIAGGGLAGMEAAHTLAERGHHVDLYEKAEDLGGQWIVAGKATYKSDFRTLIPWMLNAMKEAGVHVHTGVEVNRALLEQERPDVVVLATGAVPRGLPAAVDRPAHGGPSVVQGMDVIMDRAEVGDRVVVVGGRYIGMEVAIKLAKQGKDVSLLEAMEIGHGGIPRLVGIYRNEMVAAKVRFYPNSPLLRLNSEGVDAANNGSMLTLPCDTVVLAIGTVPVNNLVEDLEDLGLEYHAIGDCRQIGDALYAIREGAQIGRKL